ncbi:MAG TPA: ribonuclease III domain-containing protein [Planctomycetota bacterium]|nr:ribonuclease III domain-containing protein [Planctomycetota bacterium]
MNPRVEAVSAALAVRFKDEALVLQALRHASVGGVDGTDNERLEFLGDACIGLAAASFLYGMHAHATEGELTERRARVVSRSHLARVARRLGLESAIELRPPIAPGARIPDSVLAGALEALLGATYLDAGFDEAMRVARELLLDEAEPEVRANSKAMLQHLSQVRFGCIPCYRLVDERTHAFGRTFCVAAEIAGRQFGLAWGRNKREAEQGAAREAILALVQEDGAPPST